MRSPTDGLRMLTIPFMPSREVAGEVAISWLIDGHDWEYRGNYQKAIDSFTRSIQYNPDDFQAYYLRGNAWLAIKDPQQAIDDYQQAISLLDRTIKLEYLNVSNYYARAIVYYDWMKIDSTKFQNAFEDLAKVIEIDPYHQSAYFYRAYLYCCSGFKKQAVADYTKLIKLAPSANNYCNRGVTYYQFKNYQSAIEDLDLAIGLDRDNITAYYTRGNAKYELQDKLGAYRDYERAEFLSSTITFTGEEEHSFYARAIAYTRLERKVEAIEDWLMAESLCIKYGNTSLLQRIRDDLAKIDT